MGLCRVNDISPVRRTMGYLYANHRYSHTRLCIYKHWQVVDFVETTVTLLQIQLVEDGADTTSPDTPEAATSKTLKRGRPTAPGTHLLANIFFTWNCNDLIWSFIFSEIIEGPKSNKVVSEERDFNITNTFFHWSLCTVFLWDCRHS